MVSTVITALRPELKLDRRVLVLLIVVIMAVLLPYLLRTQVNIDAARLAGAGYVVLFLIGFVGGATFFLPVPCLPLVFAAAGMFNPAFVALSAASGMALGMGATYLLGHRVRDRINWRISARSDRLGTIVRALAGWLRRSSALTAFVLAVMPNPVYDFAGLIAGSSQVSVSRFLMGVFLGKTTQTLIVSLAGFAASAI